MAKDPFDIPWEDDAGAEDPIARAAALEQELAEARARAAAAEESAARARDDLVRRAAELDNARKRFARDYERACAAAAQGIVEKLLPVLDDLARAADAADADVNIPQHYVDALRLLHRCLFDILREAGLEPIAAARGDPFDAEVHEAVMVSCDPALPAGAVLAVLDPGYLFQGRLLRPARVEVCAPPSSPDE